MKLGIVNHTRCNEETLERTLVWLPDDMTEAQFEAAVAVARAEYLAFAVSFKNEPPPNDYAPHNGVPYKRFPSWIVADVEAEWQKRKVVYEAWDAQRQQARKTFGDYLAGRNGIIRFWEFDEAPFSVECDWGHQHGIKLDYEETMFD